MCPLYVCDKLIIEAGEDTKGQVLAMYCEGQCKIWLHTLRECTVFSKRVFDQTGELDELFFAVIVCCQMRKMN